MFLLSAQYSFHGFCQAVSTIYYPRRARFFQSIHVCTPYTWQRPSLWFLLFSFLSSSSLPLHWEVASLNTKFFCQQLLQLMTSVVFCLLYSICWDSSVSSQSSPVFSPDSSFYSLVSVRGRSVCWGQENVEKYSK